jgi:PAS domain S-box-containing protein
MAANPDSSIIEGRALLDAVDVAVIATDADLVVTYGNAAATRLLGFAFDHAVGHGLAEVLITADPEVAAMALAVVVQGETWSGPLPIPPRDGTELVVRSTWSPVRDEAGTIVGTIATISRVEAVGPDDGTSSPLAPLRALPAPDEGSSPVTVLVATDSLLVGEGLAAVLGAIPGLAVLGLARDHVELTRLCGDLLPQALVISLRSASDASDAMVAAARQLRGRFAELGLVLISDCGNGLALELLRDGAARIAYLLDDQLPTMRTVIDALAEVTAGQSVLDPSIVDYLLDHRRGSGVDDLTNRETDVLELMAEGCSNRAIADRLSMSVKSIEKCITSIFLNLDVTDLSSVDRRVTATLSYQRAQTTGLEAELRRVRRMSPTELVPIRFRRDDVTRSSGTDRLGA